MKKYLVLLIALILINGVFALSTTTKLQTSGSAISELSTTTVYAGAKSARLQADNITNYPPTNEGRARIELNTPILLSALDNISWIQNVSAGYISHVDVLVDINNSGSENEALTFEYDKVQETTCGNLPYTYTTGSWIDTFGNKGIVDGNAYAWSSQGPPGPCGDVTFNSTYASLKEWRMTYPNWKIYAIEIEVDGWISTNVESESFIDDVMVNGEVVEDFEGTQTGEGQVVADMTFIPNPNPLDFGAIVPGRSNTVISTLTVGASNLQVTMMSVTPTIGNVFNESNVMFSLDGVSFVDAASIPPINISAQTTENLWVKLSIPVATPSGPVSGFITYTVMEQP